MKRRIPGMTTRTRFRVGSDCLAETFGGMVIRLDEAPVGEDAVPVTVMVAPGVSLSAAAHELRLLAGALEEEALGLRTIRPITYTGGRVA